MKMGLYPGCSMKGSSREYAESLWAIAPGLGLELEEIADWNCCGATAAHNLNHTLALALPARILALAEKQGLTDILVPCAACYNRLLATYSQIREDEALRKNISEIIEIDINGSARPRNILEVLDEHLTPEIVERLAQPWRHKAACYYGCLLVRPPKLVQFDRPEDPMVMDRMLQKIGAEPIDWAFKTECCGAGFSVSRTDLVSKLCSEILDDAVARGAEAVIVACPMCHSNLDMRRGEIEKHAKKKYGIPVLYITQAIGLAMGLGNKTLGINRHIVKAAFQKMESPAAEKTSAVVNAAEV